MTPLELEQIRKMIAGEIAKAVTSLIQPLRDDIDALKLTDKRHSGTHRDLATDVKRAQSEAEHKVTDTATALALRDKVLVDALTGVETRLTARIESVETKSIKPGVLAAQGAQTAAEAAKSATTAIAVDQVQAKATAKSSLRESRLRTLAAFVALVIVALLNHFAKG